MNNDEPEDFTREYQRASAADAGSPSKATRDAILAEAQKAALRRQPAANDSRYVWRAVAGVAVLGVAVLIWRQQDSRMPIDAGPADYTVARKADSSAAGDAAAEPAAEPPAAAPAADAAVANSAAPSRPASPSFADNAARERRAEAEVSDGSELLQRTFTPAQQAAITPPASAWLIRDSSGTVLRSGVIGSPDELALIAVSAGRDFARDVSPWFLMPATTSAGRGVELHVAELR